MKRFLFAVDGFYGDPDGIRRRALAMSYSHPENVTGWRTRAHHPRGIRERIEKTFNVRIPYFESDLDAVEMANGVFFQSYDRGDHAETVGIHYDEPLRWVMFLIYLTPGAPYDAGTSLWQHRKTGITAKPTRGDAARLGMPLAELERLIERDSRTKSRWIEIDRVGNVYNRAVMFPGGFYHSATRHFGSSFENGRIYQSFHFPVRF